MADLPAKQSPADVEVGTSSEVIDMVPGTRLLLGQSRDRHGSLDIILSPEPSNDPDDPLNWSTLRTFLSFSVVNLYSFMVAVVSLSTAVTYGALIAEFHTTASYLNVGTAVSILFIGMGNIIWNPMALRYGRRPVYILSCFLTGVAQIVAATAQRSDVFVGSRILMGFVAAPFEQLPAVTVNDQFFVHQRGFALSMYVLAATLGSFLGPLATGFIVDGVGWRWVYWIFAIAMALVTILAFFLLEETGYNRDDNTRRGSGPPLQAKSYRDKLRLVSNLQLPQSLGITIIQPLKLLIEPIILWSACLYGFGISWLAIMAFTSNTVFQSPLYGYNFSYTDVGLTSLSPLVGSMILFYVGGAGTDRFMIWQARRNNGVMEPESRIYSALVAGPIMGAGLVLYGVGASSGLPWIVPVVGMGLIGAGIPIAGEVSLGYVTECYSHKAGEASTAMITVRNIIACAMIFATEPWINNNGLRDTFIIMGALCLFVFWSGLLLIWKGKSCRRRSARLWGLL
ncbi:major facilitator superfamily domain-containing protein [Ilyonectria destructans]|nr:major facilitator superfamily domain-containing protein [Ilyonectria destructans]